VGGRPFAALAFPAPFPEENYLDGIPPDDPALLELGEAPEYTEIAALPASDAPIRFYSLSSDSALLKGWKILEIRTILPAIFTRSLSGALGRLLRAWHLFQWRRDSRYCGSCGRENEDAPDETARRCPVCGRREYPRISPAMIVLVTNSAGEALLAHNRNFRNGVYSLLAGFVEAGEDLESAVIREVREEVNIEIDNIRYIASQPWPFPNSLMIGFTARYKSGELKPDGIEIEDARWFSREDLPALPGNGSVSRYLIGKWQNREFGQG
jgi:NAD+ diphosphatase